MPMYDYRCDNGHVTEQIVPLAERDKAADCPCGKAAKRVLLTPPRIDWLAMGAQRDASPEFIDRFDRLHKQQKDKEERSAREHGDYGPRPGAD